MPNYYPDFALARTPQQILSAIKDLRTTSPMKTDKDEVVLSLEGLIENTLKVKGDNGSYNLDQKAEALRKILKRDAYFLD